ncbi:hypothetical protein [Rhodosalinus sp. FB01]|uniref:hypothetical protein n=1 Tax=Rhodosalinus sp. FB01 TaxID=3239194 RepID=UPI003523FD8A
MMPTEGTARPPRLCLVHRSGRRVRLRFQSPVPQGAALAAFADGLADLTGVARALVRPRTGSVIIETLAPAGEVLEALAGSDLVRIVDAPRPVAVGQVMQLGLARTDMELARRTEGALDLRSTLAVALLGAAIVQLARGRVAGPATTLAMTAFSLLERGKRG